MDALSHGAGARYWSRSGESKKLWLRSPKAGPGEGSGDHYGAGERENGVGGKRQREFLEMVKTKAVVVKPFSMTSISLNLLEVASRDSTTVLTVCSLDHLDYHPYLIFIADVFSSQSYYRIVFEDLVLHIGNCL